MIKDSVDRMEKAQIGNSRMDLNLDKKKTNQLQDKILSGRFESDREGSIQAVEEFSKQRVKKIFRSGRYGDRNENMDQHTRENVLGLISHNSAVDIMNTRENQKILKDKFPEIK